MDGTEQGPDAKPRVNDNGIEELVTDKGCHSGAVVERVKSYQVRSCILDKQPKRDAEVAGQAEGQRAVRLALVQLLLTTFFGTQSDFEYKTHD